MREAGTIVSLQSKCLCRRHLEAEPELWGYNLGTMPDVSKRSAVTAAPLLSRLAHSARLADVLPDLHQHALEVTGGSRVLLFERNPRTGQLYATSGYGVRELGTGPWDPADAEAALLADTVALGAQTLVVDLDRQMPELAARLGALAALLIPIAQSDARLSLVAIGFDRTPDATPGSEAGQAVGDAFLAALELFRLRQREVLQRDLRDLLDEHAAMLATSLDLDRTLEAVSNSASRFFAADRTSVWLHDRRARELVLRASSDGARLTPGVRVGVDAPLAPAAVAMRQARAGLADSVPGQATATITVPLRACRRALGTMLLEGVRLETGTELDWLERADEVGRAVAGSIEFMQVLGDLERTRRDLQHAIDAMVPLVAVLNRDGTVAHVNQAFSRRTQIAADQLRDRLFTELVGPELGAWLSSLDARTGVTPSSAVCDVDDAVLAGSFTVTVTDLPGPDGAASGRVFVAREQLSRSPADVEREELHNQLTQSEKLAALGQFVAGIAHELNNPLQSVLGHLELLRVTGQWPKGARQQLHTVSREADRAAKIVRNLLVFAGSGRVARRSVSLNALLRRVVSLRLAACRTAHIQIVRHYDEKLPRIKSDPLMLHQVFLNVLVNAEQAVIGSGRPGRIEVTTAMTSDRAKVIATIRDTGPGISPEVLSRVFEPFYTTKDVGKGTGLGLAIAYGIVHDHGGEIAAANHPQGGAIFTVELPCGSAND